MVITQDNLNDIFQETKVETLAKYLDALNDLLPKNGIDTPARVAMFLAQVGEESQGLRTVVENLNYGAAGLRAVFGSHFPDGDEDDYARQPEKIANRVYANRLGNGDEDSGDGWRYRGRGAIQTTGKDHYQEVADAAGISLDEVPAYLETPAGAIFSAVLYWKKNNLNRFADREDVVGATRVINGGTNGLADRTSLYHTAMDVLGA